MANQDPVDQFLTRLGVLRELGFKYSIDKTEISIWKENSTDDYPEFRVVGSEQLRALLEQLMIAESEHLKKVSIP